MQCLLSASANISPKPFIRFYHPRSIFRREDTALPRRLTLQCGSGAGGFLHSGLLCVSLAGVTNGFGKHTESGSDSECSLGLSGGLAFEACR